MKSLLIRFYTLFSAFMATLVMRAQSLDDVDLSPRRRDADEFEGMDGFIDYQPLRFGLDDVIMVVLLLVACYVFGKIWKGCSYLILVVAAAVYFLLHY